MIFVFGSNLAGIHGGGAALHALQNEGAVLHKGKGLQGNSYALPTKGWKIQTLPLGLIRNYVDEFIHFAKANPKMQFQVTQVGCGLAGYCPEQIAPLFEHAPWNCYFDQDWRWILGSLYYNYWTRIKVDPNDLTSPWIVVPDPDWRK